MSDSIVLYHNPRCSKSRETRALLEEKGFTFEIIEYLKQPLDAKHVLCLSKMLGTPVSEIVRTGEKTFKELDNPPADSDEKALAQLIADNPILLQRPIVVNGKRAAIGRPPESVLNLF